jgi:hypothetical protein
MNRQLRALAQHHPQRLAGSSSIAEGRINQGQSASQSDVSTPRTPRLSSSGFEAPPRSGKRSRRTGGVWDGVPGL